MNELIEIQADYLPTATPPPIRHDPVTHFPLNGRNNARERFAALLPPARHTRGQSFHKVTHTHTVPPKRGTLSCDTNASVGGSLQGTAASQASAPLPDVLDLFVCVVFVV